MLRTMAINSLRLNGIWSVTEGIAALAHDIKRTAAAAGVACTSRAGPLWMTSNRPCTYHRWRQLYGA
jgi:hypothetical protein